MKKNILFLLFALILLISGCTGDKTELNTNHIDLIFSGSDTFLVVATGKELTTYDLLTYKETSTTIFPSTITAISPTDTTILVGLKDGTLYSTKVKSSNKNSNTKSITLAKPEKVAELKSTIQTIATIKNRTIVHLHSGKLLYINRAGKLIKETELTCTSLKIRNAGIGYKTKDNMVYFKTHSSKKPVFAIKDCLSYTFNNKEFFFSKNDGFIYSVDLNGKNKKTLDKFTTPRKNSLQQLSLSLDNQFLIAVARDKKRNASLFMAYKFSNGEIFLDPISGIITQIKVDFENRWRIYLFEQGISILGFQQGNKKLLNTIRF